MTMISFYANASPEQREQAILDNLPNKTSIRNMAGANFLTPSFTTLTLVHQVLMSRSLDSFLSPTDEYLISDERLEILLTAVRLATETLMVRAFGDVALGIGAAAIREYSDRPGFVR